MILKNDWLIWKRNDKRLLLKKIRIVNKPKIELPKLHDLINAIYFNFSQRCYFQEYFGYDCVDNGFVPGRLGSIDSIEFRVFSSLGHEFWPFHISIFESNENELFDIIEFLYDHISVPIDGKGWIHTYNGCGWHFSDLDNDFDKHGGQEEYRNIINEILEHYSKGYKLSEEGEILVIAEKGFESLLDQKVPFTDNDLEPQLDHAIQLYRNRHSNLDDRKDALRNLADILERLRTEASEVLRDNDEREIFQLLNKFGIRHNNLQQNTNYDKDIFYSWMFYYLLAAIHACQHLLNRKKC